MAAPIPPMTSPTVVQAEITLYVSCLMLFCVRREGEREGGREGGREGEKERENGNLRNDVTTKLNRKVRNKAFFKCYHCLSHPPLC